MGKFENKALEKIQRESVKSIMNVIILAEIRNGITSGYDLMKTINNKFGISFSSGTVYAHIYALEREGLITSYFEMKKMVFNITEKGEKTLQLASKANMDALNTLKDVLKT